MNRLGILNLLLRKGWKLKNLDSNKSRIGGENNKKRGKKKGDRRIRNLLQEISLRSF